jgi:hypothetical protein
MINGTKNPTLNAEFLNFTPFEGGELGGTYEGEKNRVYTQALVLIGAGYSVRYQYDQGLFAKCTFSAAFSSTGGGPPPTPNADYKDTWELVRSSVHKELLESDHPLVSVLEATAVPALRAAFANPAKYPNGPDIPLPQGAASLAAATYLWKLYTSGTKTVEVKQPVLKLTRTTNPLYDAPFNTANIDKVMLTNTMKSDSGVPANFAVPLINLANALMAKSGGAVIQARNDGLDFRFGWLKELVGVYKHGRQRMQYVLEYKFGLYDAKLYGVPV